MNAKKIFLLTLGAFFVWSVKAQADMEQIKAYKEAFPDAKPKCVDCHVDAIPKKDEGKHNLNAYGSKVKETSAKPTAETYKKVGKASEYKKGENPTENKEKQATDNKATKNK